MEVRVLSTREKALEFNLDPRTYGSFAEIGAGQETAATFFKAGAASGTIAKTISAYDMTFSDFIYGAEESGRYVCEPRLMKMLNREFNLLIQRLSSVRSSETLFFAFADTVTTINFKKTNQGQGWLGIRFQLHPNAEPNDIVLHVRLMEKDALAQQYAVGTVGVNLVYGAFYYYRTPELLIDSLMDNIVTDKIRIDMIRFSGPEFKNVDNRLMMLHLVWRGFTNAAAFKPDGTMVEPSEVFYKKNILCIRSRFRPFTLVNLDMLKTGYQHFVQEKGVEESKIVTVAEITLNNLRSETGIDHKDFLDRVDMVSSLGYTVLISNYQEYYRLAGFFARHTKQKIGIIMGPFNLSDIFNDRFYANLRGGILESFAQLFSLNVELYIYPTKDPVSGVIINIDNFKVQENLDHLFKYLIANDKISGINGYDENLLHIFSDNVLKMIKSGENGWESMVPPEVETAVKTKKLFGYKG
jgi:hypothetical protein